MLHNGIYKAQQVQCADSINSKENVFFVLFFLTDFKVYLMSTIHTNASK